MGLAKISVGDKFRKLDWDEGAFIEVLELTFEDGWDYDGVGRDNTGRVDTFHLGKQHLHRCVLYDDKT